MSTERIYGCIKHKTQGGFIYFAKQLNSFPVHPDQPLLAHPGAAQQLRSIEGRVVVLEKR